MITGMGAVSPIGNTVEEMWQAAKHGRCGIGPITLFDTVNHKVKIAGEVKGLDLDAYIDKREQRKMDRFAQFALAAAQQAFAQSGLVIDEENPRRCGVVMATGIGGLQSIEDQHSQGLEKGFDRVSPYFIPLSIANMAAGHVAIRFGFQGMCTCPVTACAGGSNAIGDAFRQVRDGYLDVALAGGAEASITPLGIGGFTSLKALTTEPDPVKASIPFDARRSGFVMGEGAGALVLEEYQHAKARGAVILGEMVGYGTTCDAYHITAPLADGSGGAGAMTLALEDADIPPEAVGYLNAHGTSTPLNDAGETAAVKLAFGPHAHSLAISSTKSMTGHLLGASGAVEAILTILCLQNDFVVPTIGLEQRDEACDLDYVPGTGRPKTLQYAMSNSLGFGGHNASILFKKFGGD